MKVILGIDVSSTELETHILADSDINAATKIFKNNIDGCKKLIQYVNKNKITEVVVEATGGYEKLITKHCLNNNIAIKIVNPAQVRNFAKGIGKLAKTDRIDAFVIAKFAQVVKTPEFKARTEEEMLLTELVKRRNLLTKMIVAEKNRRRLAGDTIMLSINTIVKALEKEIKAISDKMEELRKNSDAIKNKCKILCTQKGVGKLTALSVVALLPELGTLNRKQIASLTGLAPIPHDSGKKKGKRFIAGGRFNARRVLYMPAWVAVKFDKTFNSFFQRLIDKSKAPKVAITAVMRRLIVLLNGMLRKEYYKIQN